MYRIWRAGALLGEHGLLGDHGQASCSPIAGHQLVIFYTWSNSIHGIFPHQEVITLFISTIVFLFLCIYFLFIPCIESPVYSARVCAITLCIYFLFIPCIQFPVYSARVCVQEAKAGPVLGHTGGHRHAVLQRHNVPWPVSADNKVPSLLRQWSGQQTNCTRSWCCGRAGWASGCITHRSHLYHV